MLHPVLAAAAAELGLAADLGALTEAAELSHARVAQARTQVAEDCLSQLDLVAFGSLGRDEVTAESDFDFLVLATELPDDPDSARRLVAKGHELRRSFAVSEGRTGEVKGPGASGIFGTTVGAFDLIERIGLQNDTNHSLTRRMLLLQESVSLGNPEVHAKVLRATLDRYLKVIDARPNRPARFLLNDVIRYWRTVTVDYQAKALDGGGPVSGLRYLKLIVSRKLVFAGTLMSLLCERDGARLGTVEYLYEQFTMPPLARLVAARQGAPEPVQDAFRQILSIANRFIECSADSQWREAVDASAKDPNSSTVEFDQMRELARELQTHLETIFFTWDRLAQTSRHYLAF